MLHLVLKLENKNNSGFGFGSRPYMKEVPPTKEAIFSFRGQPEIVETEYGEKYSFPIILISHPSYETLPQEMEWQSKCMSARQLYDGLNATKKDLSWKEDLDKAYKKSKWQLTRFDNGAYYLSVV